MANEIEFTYGNRTFKAERAIDFDGKSYVRVDKFLVDGKWVSVNQRQRQMITAATEEARRIFSKL